MTDQPSDQPSNQQGDGSLPELTPEQESAVRQLLAEARHDEPIPTDVADRLDTVLAGLTRDQPGAPGVAPVIDLAARRRRRNAAAVLAGAAAVIVAGFTMAQVIEVDSNDAGDSATSADAGADRDGAAKDQQAERAPQAAPGDLSSTATDEVGVLHLSSKHLERDLNEQLAGYTYTADQQPEEEAGSAYASVGCTPPQTANEFGLGDLFPALYDDTPAVLALRPPADGRQQADVLDCDTAQLLASVTVAPR